MKADQVFRLLPATATDVARALKVDGQIASRYLNKRAHAGVLVAVGEREVKVGGSVRKRIVYDVAHRGEAPRWGRATSEAFGELGRVPWMQPREPRLSDKHVGHVHTRTHHILGSWALADE